MRLRHIAAVTAAACALALGAAGTSNAAVGTTHQHAKHAVTATHAPQVGGKLIRVAAPHINWNCLETIGQPGNFGYRTVNGMEYAGQVEQIWDNCDKQIFAHWQWSTNFKNEWPNDTIRLAIGSPDGPTYWATAAYASQGQDDWFIFSDGTGVDYRQAQPQEAWRAGAEVNDCTWISWGTLHNYAGYDQNGPTVTSGGGVFPRAPW
jgi:hypothetical protein